LELEGPHRRLHIEQVAATLSQTQGIRADAVSVVHDPDGRSRLYYGVYFRRADRKTGKLPVDANLRQDFELIQQLGDGAGARYFLKARLVRQPQPDVGDPQWSLTRAEGLYSLQVAAFEPTDDFWEYKQAAAEYCAWLRKKEYPAYYHHGPACSIVTVGTFGATAVVPSANGLPRYGPEVVRMQEDPLLMYNLVNGAIVKARVSESSDVARFNALAQSGQSAKDSKKLAVPSYSRLVPIPGRAQEAHP